MAKKNSNLRLGDWWDYTPYKLNQQSEAVLRAEYTRLRKIANARGEALARSEFADTKSAQRVIRRNKNENQNCLYVLSICHTASHWHCER